LLCH